MFETIIEAPKRGTYDAALDEIIGAVAEVFDVEASEITGRRRLAPISVARLAVYVVARGKEIPPTAIMGRLNRDRSLSYHYEQSSADLIQSDSTFSDRIRQVEVACS